VIERRAFLAGTGAVFLAAPLAVQAQQSGKVWRIGLLVSGAPPGEHQCVLALRRGLTDLGYVEGRTHVLEIRWAEGRSEDTFPRFGAELVRLGVDLVVSVTSQGLPEAKRALAAVPVVMAVGSYPVERGLVASLSRPGANITGMATFTGDLYAKRIQLLAEAVPGVLRVAVLRIPGDQSNLIVRDFERAARQLGLKLRVIELKGEGSEDLPAAFQTASRGSAQAVMTTQGPFLYQHRHLIAELALKHRLPSLSGEPLAAEAGTLVTYGASIDDSCHRAATFVDRILKGAKPADIPVEQPTKYELVINLKTAKALGLTIPPSLLQRADQVIE
jgi:putative tryptophan/tyrosine transport system substrate-binding protein